MQIRVLDIDDDAVMRECYDVQSRAERVGREHLPFWTFQEFLGAMRGPDEGELCELHGAFVGDDLVGTCVTWVFLHDNTEKAYGRVLIDPTFRRQGIGRAMVEDFENRARGHGRSLVLSDSNVPHGERESHDYRRFAEACGYALSNVEVVRHLALPVPDAQIQTWIDHAAQKHADYTIETFVDVMPDELVESLCLLMSQLVVDAPTGEVDFEEETMTPTRFAERYVTADAMGRSIFETLALTPERVVAAQSTLVVSRGDSPVVFQWGTFVHREHRGHRLGLATKAINLRAVQEAHPGKERVTTQNGETNDYMVSINAEMGFEPVEESAEWFKTL